MLPGSYSAEATLLAHELTPELTDPDPGLRGGVRSWRLLPPMRLRCS